jgi:hypothetical protein
LPVYMFPGASIEPPTVQQPEILATEQNGPEVVTDPLDVCRTDRDRGSLGWAIRGLFGFQ